MRVCVPLTDLLLSEIAKTNPSPFRSAFSLCIDVSEPYTLGPVVTGFYYQQN